MKKYTQTFLIPLFLVIFPHNIHASSIKDQVAPSTPVTSIAPSGFHPGTQLITTSDLNVRQTAGGFSSPIVGQQSTGATGTVLSGLQRTADGFVWVPVDFDIGVDGWVASAFIAQIHTTSSDSNTIKRSTDSLTIHPKLNTSPARLATPFMTDIQPGTGKLLPPFSVVGPQAGLDAYSTFATKGPGIRDWSQKFNYAASEGRAYYAGGNHGVPHKFNDLWTFDLGLNQWEMQHAPDQGVSTLHAYAATVWDDKAKRYIWFEDLNTPNKSFHWPLKNASGVVDPEINIVQWSQATGKWTALPVDKNIKTGSSNAALLFPETDQLWLYSSMWQAPVGINVVELAGINEGRVTEVATNRETYHNVDAPGLSPLLFYSRTTGKIFAGEDKSLFVYDIPTKTWTRTDNFWPGAVITNLATSAYSERHDKFYFHSVVNKASRSAQNPGIFWSYDPLSHEIEVIDIPGMFSGIQETIMYYDESRDLLVIYQDDTERVFVYRPSTPSAYRESVPVPDLLAGATAITPTTPLSPTTSTPSNSASTVNNSFFDPPVTINENFGIKDLAEKIWCPDGNGSFKRIARYSDLPNDPIGDGKNDCYMEAFDTTVFTTNGQPIQGCSNLDLSKFPGHTCNEIRTVEEFSSKQIIDNSVSILMNDIFLPRGKTAWIGTRNSSHWLIGLYDPATMRPVHIESEGQPISWNSTAPVNILQMMNLRITTDAHCAGNSGTKGTENNFVGQSITGKCGSRFMIAGFESMPSSSTFDVADQTIYEADDKIYLKNILVKAKNSHTVYLDRNYINWIEDSIFLGSRTGGNHPAKLTAKNVIVRNAVFSNTGAQGQSYIDPDPEWKGTKAGLAPLSLAACSRVSLDGLTILSRYVEGSSNSTAIQWQDRDALGAGCDLPMGYYPNAYPTKPYYGPVIYNGQRFESNPYWTSAFWAGIDETKPLTDPGMITSYVTNTEIIQTYEDKDQWQPHIYALLTAGTVPTTRPDSSTGSGWIFPEHSPDWKELTRIVVSGNCLDNGILVKNMTRMYPHVYTNSLPFGAGRISPVDNTDKFIMVGTNQCANKESPAPEVIQARDAWINTLEQPPWLNWK